MRDDKVEAAAIDAELDAREIVSEATRVARSAADPDDAAAPEGDEQGSLWWQEDPRFTDRFRPS
jgi:hypothetical protein